jgi:hypothetical protein
VVVSVSGFGAGKIGGDFSFPVSNDGRLFLFSKIQIWFVSKR